MPQSGEIGEAQIEHLHVVLLDKCQDCFRIGLGIRHWDSPCPSLGRRHSRVGCARTAVGLRCRLCGTSCPRLRQLARRSGAAFRSRNSELRTALVRNGCGFGLTEAHTSSIRAATTGSSYNVFMIGITRLYESQPNDSAGESQDTPVKLGLYPASKGRAVL